MEKLTMTRPSLSVYRDEQYFSAFPALVAWNGALWLWFRRAPNYKLLAGEGQVSCHLDARSHLVSGPLNSERTDVPVLEALAGHPLLADQDPSLLVLGTGQLLAVTFSWLPIPEVVAQRYRDAGHRVEANRHSSGIAFALAGATASILDDHGKFTARVPMPSLRDARDEWVSEVACRGQPVQIGRRIVVPLYGRALGSALDSAFVAVSEDEGRTFVLGNFIGRAHGDVEYQEPTLCRVGDDIVAFVRTAGAQGKLAVAVSRDGGDTFSDAVTTEVDGCPAHAVPVGRDRALVVYGYRKPPYGVRARMWRDGVFGDELIVDDTCTSTDCGYPWVASLGSDGYAVAYYSADERGSEIRIAELAVS